MIVAVPFAIPLTTPFEVTVAIFLLLVVHVTALLLAEAGAAVALRVTVFPLRIDAEVLLSVILVTGCFTVILQNALTPLPSLAVAVIVAVPFAIPLTTPFASTVAIFLSLLVQLRALLPASSGVTVALMVTVFPTKIEALVLSSVTAETGLVTVTWQTAEAPVLSAASAVTVAVPAATAVTRPFWSTVTTFSSPEDQFTAWPA